MHILSAPRLFRAPLIAVVALVAICALFVDQPTALWSQRAFYNSSPFLFAEFALETTKYVAVGLGLYTLVGLVWRKVRLTTPAWLGDVIRAGLAMTLALGLSVMLKFAFGRSQVWPLYLKNHVVAMRPFAGDTQFMAFPSGTLAATTAVVAAIAASWSDRLVVIIGVLVVLLVTAAIVITNGHWVSDLIGGAYVGVCTASASRAVIHKWM